MNRRWMGAVFFMVIVSTQTGGCDKKTGGGAVDLECTPDWLKPCEVEACEACEAMGGHAFLILESYPPQYACGDEDGHRIEGYHGYDYCELPYCGETVTVLPSTSTETTAGVTAGDVLALAEGVHSLPLTWLPDGSVGGIELDPDGVTMVDVTVHHDAGELRHVEREEVVPETDGIPDIGPGVVVCHETVEADVEFMLVTHDGGLGEAMTATLTQVVDGEGPLPSTIDKTIPWSGLQGSLTVTSISSGYTVDDDVSLHTSFESAGIEGHLETGVEHRSDDAVGHTVLTVAKW